MTQDRRRYEPQSLRKALRILACFEQGPEELSVADLASQLEMKQSTLYRYLVVLTEEQYIEKVPGKPRYRLGPALILLAGLALARLEVRRLGQSELGQLAHTLGMKAHLAILDQGDVLYIAYADPVDGRTHAVRSMDGLIGRRVPAHHLATGKVLLAFRPEDETRRTIQTYGWRPRTEHSIQDFRTLHSVLGGIRERGFLVERGELIPSDVFAAAPIRERSGSTIAALCAVGDERIFDPPGLERIVHEVCHRANSLSLRLGYGGSPIVPHFPQPELE